MWFTNIIKDVETFAAKAEAELAKFLGEAPKIEQIGQAVLSYAGPLLTTIATAAKGSAAGAAVQAVINKAQADLTAAGGLFAAIQPGTNNAAVNIINGVAADLPDALTLAGVKDAASVATAKQVVKELAAVAAVVPAEPAPAAPAADVQTNAVAIVAGTAAGS